MKTLKGFWHQETGSISNRVSLLVVAALLLLVVSGAIDESVRSSGMAWAEQVVHRMGF